MVYIYYTYFYHKHQLNVGKYTPYPIGSMYGIFTYIYHKNQPNVGIYHTWILWVDGWYGL